MATATATAAENALLDAINFHKMAACRHALVFDDSWPVGDESAGVEHGERVPTRIAQRNGHRPKLLSTPAGDVELGIPGNTARGRYNARLGK